MENPLPSPKEIYEYLCEHVIGQDDAKKTLSVAVYNHYKRLHFSSRTNPFQENIKSIDKDLSDVQVEKSNILLLGNTGTGKTYMIKQIAKMLGVPCYIADMTKVTESGYVGDDVESVLSGLLRECEYEPEVAQCGIVVLDEIDKIVKRNAGQSLTRDVGGVGVQQSLLKIIEGSVVNVPPAGGRKHPEQPGIPIDTTNILFIGLGAFEDLDKQIKARVVPNKGVGYSTVTDKVSKKYADDYNYLKEVSHEDIKQFGFIAELVGRFPVITYTNPLDEKDLIKILTEPKNSILKQYRKLLAADNIDLKIDKKAYKEIAKIAQENGTGARALKGILERVLFKTMFDCYNMEEKTVVTVTAKDIKAAA